MTMKNYCASLFVCLFVLMPIAGCGEKGPVLHETTGIVTLDGQPCDSMMVRLSPGAVSGVSGPDGTFALYYPVGKRGAPEGEYSVRIIWNEIDDVPPVHVPAKYNSKTELKASIVKGKNELRFDLLSK